MAEAGDLELFNGPAPKELNEKTDEQIREQMRQAQKALMQLKKEEGKAKRQDGRVAQVIVQFLSDPKNTDLFLLISRCVADDIPSELILAVLALVDQDSYQETEKFLQGPEGEAYTPEKALMSLDKDHLSHLSPQQRQLIEIWISHIFQVASKRPHRCLEALVKEHWVGHDEEEKKKIREISPSFVQLSAFVMRRFFAAQKTMMEFEELHGFMQVNYVKLVAHLEALLEGQKQLGYTE